LRSQEFVIFCSIGAKERTKEGRAAYSSGESSK
jgi:hypothetical protein